MLESYPSAAWALQYEQNNMYHSPVLAEYTPMYMDWVTFIASGISQRYIPSSPPLLRFKCTIIWPLVLWKSQLLPEPGTLVLLGKNQFPKAVRGGRQQAVWLVTQSRASSPSPMFSRIMILLFWYVIFLSENLTSPAREGSNIQVTKRFRNKNRDGTLKNQPD